MDTKSIFSEAYSASLSNDSSVIYSEMYHRKRSGSALGPSIETNPELDGTLVKIQPAFSKQWVGKFCFGVGELTALVEMPSKTQLCVISKGEGYIVDIDQPNTVTLVKCVPVKRVHVELMPHLIVFSDFTRFCAYSENGLLWQSEDVSWDGISEVMVGEEVISGKGWSAPKEAWIPFRVRTSDGRVTGGAASI